MTRAPLAAGDRVVVVGDGRASYQWLGHTGTIIATTRYGHAWFEVDVSVAIDDQEPGARPCIYHPNELELA